MVNIYIFYLYNFRIFQHDPSLLVFLILEINIKKINKPFADMKFMERRLVTQKIRNNILYEYKYIFLESIMLYSEVGTVDAIYDNY